MNDSRSSAHTHTRTRVIDRIFSYIDGRSSFDRMLLLVVATIFLLTSSIWVWQYSQQNQVVVPSSGGVLKEGLVGVPRFVNPVLAITRADQDLTALLYRSLVTLDAEGNLVNDLASDVAVSDDGLTYNITLKENQFWHDGVEITAEDVVYTIGLIQDPELKSPLRGNWNDAVVESINTYELSIQLEEAYVPFQENLALGILPRHLWQNFTADEFPFSQYNTEPVGSGPYQIRSILRSESGLITQYTLERSDTYEPAANIEIVEVHFFNDESAVLDALEVGDITHTAALESERVAAIADEFTVYSNPLPRVFALYPNQNRSAVLRDGAARQALSEAVDRESLVASVLAGYGDITSSPLPTGFGPDIAASTSTIETAITTLLSGGWEQAEDGSWNTTIDDTEVTLAVTITTANTPLFEALAEAVAASWSELGVDVSIALYEQADLVQAVIRPRDYELLLFGTEIGRALDYYPFWHSSQREDPGLNIALYTSITTDDILEDYRTTPDAAVQQDLLAQFVTELAADTPAIFLFNPHFTYVTTSDTPITIPNRLGRPSDRFATIHEWHIESESLWPMFTQN